MQWDGRGSAIDLVVSLNLHRRHLTASQRAAVAVDVLPMYEAEARERQGARTDIVEIIPQSDNGRARDHAATLFNTNGRRYGNNSRSGRTCPLGQKCPNGRMAGHASRQRRW